MCKKFIVSTFLIVFSVALLTKVVPNSNFVSAQSKFIGGSDEDDDLEELTDQIEELEVKIQELQGQEKTLKNEIAYFNSQISLTQLRIQNAIDRKSVV